MSAEADLSPLPGDLPPAERPQTGQGPGERAPGILLGQMRAERQLSVADVAERLKYSQRQIEALEADDYGKLPGATFVRGMIRGYAKLLQTDPAPVLAHFEGSHAPPQASLNLHGKLIPFPDGNRRATRLYFALTVLVLVAAAAVFYEWQFSAGPGAPPLVRAPLPAPVAVQQASQPPQAAQEPASDGMPQESGTAAEPRPVAPGVGKRMVLEFQKESWVEIKDGGGKTLLSQLNAPGSRVVLQGTPPFSLVIGNAAGVRLTYDDAVVDLRPHVKVEVARLTLN